MNKIEILETEVDDLYKAQTDRLCQSGERPSTFFRRRQEKNVLKYMQTKLEAIDFLVNNPEYK